MSRKPKFKPVISRVKLNPEQAVLTCNCYDTGNYGTSFGFHGWHDFAPSLVCGSRGAKTVARTTAQTGTWLSGAKTWAATTARS